MSQISVRNLTFYYEGSFDYIFRDASFSLDTNWKLGLIGRNGKGKTTLLHLLCGRYPYQGVIQSPDEFGMFPLEFSSDTAGLSAAELLEEEQPDCPLWRIICELAELNEDADILYRPYDLLSPGEKIKLQLAVLFSADHRFCLLDEPTNHLDQQAREAVKRYLSGKKGFILVSHDRDLLDACTDHMLVLNRSTIEVQQGNFSVWQENKQRKDQFAEAENEKHRREIRKLHRAAARTSAWAAKSEQSKIGYDPVKEHDRCISSRSFIGAKTKKMQSRVRQIENRISREIEEKEGLLQDIESMAEVRLTPLKHHKQTLLTLTDYGIRFPGAEEPLFSGLRFRLQQGERIAVHGVNGCGKSTLLRAILHHAGVPGFAAEETGECSLASGLRISYIPQEITQLCGMLQEFCESEQLDFTMFCSMLRLLDFERVQFRKPMETYSDGQKKKVLLASSLLKPAHLFIWDEPLNYIDVFSRMQIEKLILDCSPTMLFVEHDARFRENTATGLLLLDK